MTAKIVSEEQNENNSSKELEKLKIDRKKAIINWLTCTRLIIMIALLYTIYGITWYQITQNVTKDLYSKPIIKQVVSDWTALPFVDLVVADEKCPKDYEPLFRRTWRGTNKGYVVHGELKTNDEFWEKYRGKKKMNMPKYSVI